MVNFMALHFILGGSGQGKSTFLQNFVTTSAKQNPRKSFFYIVPEQFTMETQKDLVNASANHGILNIDVLSFVRLAYRVFGEVGTSGLPTLDDLGKVMILRKLLYENQNQLHYFKSNIHKKGYISELKSFISELYQYGITPEKLQDMIDVSQGKPLLAAKLKDMEIIYNSFREYLSGRYIPSEELLDTLSHAVEQSSLLTDSVMIFDGFTGFTPAQYKVLEQLLCCCQDIYVALTIPQNESLTGPDLPQDLFHLSRHTIHRLSRLAQSKKIQIANPVYPSEDTSCHRFKDSPSLAALEQNLFRHPVTPFTQDTEDIQIFSLKNPAKEVSFAITRIHHLIREENYRYRDISIVTGDMPVYGPLLSLSLQKAGIPCFVDQKREVLNNPLVRHLLSAFDCLSHNWDYESVFSFLRCPTSVLSREQVDMLENYVLATGVKGYKRWHEIWTKYPTDQSQTPEETAHQLEYLNELRTTLIQELSLLEPLVKGRHLVSDFCSITESFMEQEDLCRKIENMAEDFRQIQDELSAREYQQIYDIAVDVLAQMKNMLGGEMVSLKEYYDLLHTGFEEARVGLIPPCVDQIVVGDIDRTRLSHVKILFLLGANDGIIPHLSGSGGILSDAERSFLDEQAFELAPTARQAAYTEQFYLYLNLTKPSHRLYITYAQTNQEGKSSMPSYIINRIQQIFPNLQPENMDDAATLLHREMPSTEELLGADQGMQILLEGLRRYGREDMPEHWMELYRYHCTHLPKDTLKKLINGASYHEEKSSISHELANLLYGSIVTGSVSRMESFSSCPFSHFLTYGMGLKERKEFSIKAPDFGNIMHDALKIFSDKMAAHKLDWATIDEETRTAYSREALLSAGKNYNGGIMEEDLRTSHLLSRMQSLMVFTTWALGEQMKQGNFRTELSEFIFDNYTPGASIFLRGRIDRIDTCETEDTIYVKIVDYKTGEKKFDLQETQEGLQLQLMVYLNVAVKIIQEKHPEKQVIPAGIYYYHLDNPVIEKDASNNIFHQDATLMAQEEKLKALRLDGLTAEDTSILTFTDNDFAGENDALAPSHASLAVRITTKKDGSLAATSQTIPAKDLAKILEETDKQLSEMGQQILSGNSQVSPYQKGIHTACDYCPYPGICRFHPGTEGCSFRTL